MGLMLLPDPARAAAELARVLRPGGRAAVAVWGPREANPWLAVLLDAVGAELGVEVPPPGVPGPFSLADAGRLADLLRDAGLEAVAVDEVEPPFRAASAEAWWAVVPSLAGPLAQLLDALPPPTAQAIHDRAVDADLGLRDAGRRGGRDGPRARGLRDEGRLARAARPARRARPCGRAGRGGQPPRRPCAAARRPSPRAAARRRRRRS